MKLGAALCLSAIFALTGCGGISDSGLNPLKWSGSSKRGPATLDPAGGYGAGDYRVPVSEVTRLLVEPIRGGALVTAFGLPPTQGWWDTELRAENGGVPVDGVLTLVFIVSEPRTAMPASTPQSREVTASIFLSSFKLADVRTIVVTGERNSRSSRR